MTALARASAWNVRGEEGVAVVVKAREERHRLIVEQLGQRKAMLFDAVRSYGVKRYQFTENSLEDGRVVIAFVPILRDPARRPMGVQVVGRHGDDRAVLSVAHWLLERFGAGV